ncbi:unnamed protein product [Cuscuta epithymum]|uniref:Uncharacterized protein n=1 Tax=Cuscuta epithymum TaxID=186058 RepID=A0AAV0DZY9_9ASTE|nr:unnamed protein product [Cuscuta epithymum]
MAEPAPSSASIGGSTVAEEEQRNKPINPLLSLLSAFLQLFKPPPSPKPAAPEETQPISPKQELPKEEEKPSVVKFPKAEFPSLKLESQESETDTNPVVLWQVYAIGGFFVLKWAWSRWNERKLKKRPSNENTPPPSMD